MPFQVAELSLGWDYSLALSSDGEVFGWGSNQFGQLGLGEINFTASPQPVPLVSPARLIATQFRHTIIVSQDGRQLFGCGEHVHGQLGKSPHQSISRTEKGSPSTSPAASSIIKKEKWKKNLGERMKKNRQWRTPVSLLSLWETPDLFGGAAVKDVACGQRHSIILDDRGRVWGLGDNRFGQLGEDPKAIPSLFLPQPLERFPSAQKVFCGWSYSLLLVSDGTIQIVGRNNYGQLATQEPLIGFPNRIEDVAAGSEHVLIHLADGTVYGWGWNEHGQLGVNHEKDSSVPVTPHWPSPLTRVISLSCGAAQCFALLESSPEESAKQDF